MRRLVGLAGVVTALLAAVLCAPPSARADVDPYPPKVPTTCHVSVPAAVSGKRVVVRVAVAASDGRDPRGSVRVSIDSGWSTSRSYDGQPLRIVGPRLADGAHVAQVRFVPKGNRYRGCRDAVDFNVGAESGGTPSGQLPNTGGPHLMVLLAGLGLVVSGGGLVELGRRRT